VACSSSSRNLQIAKKLGETCFEFPTRVRKIPYVEWFYPFLPQQAFNMPTDEDERTRLSGRIPPRTYDRLCHELPAFSTDTARVQFLVQYYLDDKDAERCMPPAHPPAESHDTSDEGYRETTSPQTETDDSQSESIDSETQPNQREQSPD
jgi:hypothetical protein